MGLEMTADPALEPLSVAEAKQHLRLSTDSDDRYIAGLLLAAREMIEADTRRAFITQSWRLTLDYDWTSHGDSTTRHRGHLANRSPHGGFDGRVTRWRRRIVLPRPPLQQVTSITYVDGTGTTQTLDPSQYVANKADTSEWYVEPAFGVTWPAVQPIPAAIAVNFTAGYGDEPDSVPEPLRISILMLIGQWYDQRSPLHLFSRSAAQVSELPNTVEALVRRYRLMY